MDMQQDGKARQSGLGRAACQCVGCGHKLQEQSLPCNSPLLTPALSAACVVLIRCQVRNQESGSPQLVAVSSAVGFGNLDLSIHSYSADWLYQALLYVFSGVIRSQIEGAVDNAMHTVSQQRGQGSWAGSRDQAARGDTGSTLSVVGAARVSLLLGDLRAGAIIVVAQRQQSLVSSSTVC